MRRDILKYSATHICIHHKRAVLVWFICVLQCVAVCCSVLQCVAVCCCASQHAETHCITRMYVLQLSRSLKMHMCVAVCFSVLQCVATHGNTLQHKYVYITREPASHDPYMGCSVFHCVAVRRNTLQPTATHICIYHKKAGLVWLTLSRPLLAHILEASRRYSTCCSVAMCCNMLQRVVAVCGSIL